MRKSSNLDPSGKTKIYEDIVDRPMAAKKTGHVTNGFDHPDLPVKLTPKPMITNLDDFALFDEVPEKSKKGETPAQNPSQQDEKEKEKKSEKILFYGSCHTI